MLRIGIISQKYIDIVGIGQKDFWSCIESDINHGAVSGCFKLKRSIPLYLRDKNMDYAYKELVKYDKTPKTELQINALFEYLLKLAFNDPEIDKIALKNLYQCRLTNNFENFFIDILNCSIKLQNNLKNKTFVDRFGNVLPFFKIDDNGKIIPYIDDDFINKRMAEITTDIDKIDIEDTLKKKLFEESLKLTSRINSSDISDTIFANVSINNSPEKLTFDKALKKITPYKNWNIALIGDGGMGKTILLKNYWCKILEEKNYNSVPIYIDLSEYNISEKDNFIIKTIFKDYLSAIRPLDKDMNDLYNFIKTPIKHNSTKLPSMILLLDGLNEVKDNSKLLYEIEDLNELEGLQIIISSRGNFIDTYSWNEYNLLKLIDLNENQIENYLFERNKINHLAANFDKTLNNPMILTLFTNSCEIINEFKNNEYVNFKLNTESKGEIFWNYIESNLTKKINENKEYEVYLYDFIFKHVISYIGYYMQNDNQFRIDERTLRKLSKTSLNRLSNEDFREFFYTYDDSIIIEKVSKLKQFNRFKSFLKEVQIIKKINKHYSFSHQYFRDYFSAVFIINELELGLYYESIPKVISEKLISDDVLIFIGEIIGEHKNKPTVINGRWVLNNDVILVKYLDILRDFSYNEFGFALYNILKIIHLVRGELSGIDLTNLDFRNVILNNIKFNKYSTIGVLSTKFNNSIIHENKLLPRNLYIDVSCSKYYLNDNKILLGSNDGVIREWCVRNHICRSFYIGHNSKITSIMYDKYGEKILSSSSDGTIREWCTTTKNCIMIYEGHELSVNSAMYSGDFKKILSVSDDGTVREWSTETGKIINVFQKGYSGLVTYATYSPDDKKILVTSSDATVREYSLDTNNYVAIYKGHAGVVKYGTYSPSGDRVITSSNDKTIREYLTTKNQSINVYHGHKGAVNYVNYNLQGNKIISASDDGLIIEWDVTNAKIINIYEGHKSKVNTVQYNSNNEKILSSSNDGTVKEWSTETTKCINTYKNIPGIFVYNCIFKNLSPDSAINKETIKILTEYGANNININVK